MLSKSDKLQKVVSQKVAEWINCGKFPKYLKEGRLVLLGKNQGEQYPEINNTIPIVINSHLSKIIEKVIINKLQERKSELLETGNYQNGFKENKSTHLNLIRLFDHIKDSRRKSKSREAYLFIDYKKHTTLSGKTNYYKSYRKEQNVNRTNNWQD
ncbi:hypothetical protein OXYTRIMIC_662 [Oxytricha trifallax]|uniref:Reverse transcriptase domain-containing protein n=1 Tax=Oxytricha trifallax TaxID=1172189 RepID=A0A073HYE3_9SPIT|nr:hypothetical protein OXYTRIMIC_662 [Oxytricha trifallax]